MDPDETIISLVTQPLAGVRIDESKSDATESSNTSKTSEVGVLGYNSTSVETSFCLASCPVCGRNPSPKRSLQLLACLHSMCLKCTMGKETVVCILCAQETKVACLEPEFLHNNKIQDRKIDHNLVSLILNAETRIGLLTEEVSELCNTLGDLQKVRDKTRSLVEEIFKSYKVILEQREESVFMELEKRHQQMKIEIKEKIDNYENTKSCMKQAVMYSNQVVTNCSWVEQQQLGSIVKDRLNSLLDQLIRQPVELQTSLE